MKIEIHQGDNLVILSRDARDETVHLNFIRQPNKTRHVGIYVFNDKLEKCPTYSMSVYAYSYSIERHLSLHAKSLDLKPDVSFKNAG